MPIFFYVKVFRWTGLQYLIFCKVTKLGTYTDIFLNFNTQEFLIIQSTVNLKEKIEKEDWALFLCTEIGSRGYNLKKECVNDFSTLCKFVFFVYSCIVCKKGEAAQFP